MKVPYTFNKDYMNIKDREVFCPECQVGWITNLPDPRCGECHSKLLTVINGPKEKTNESQ